MTAIAQSFFAAFVGWLVPFAANMLRMQFGPGFGYITDFGFFAFWPLFFTLLGWATVGIPLSVRLADVEPLGVGKSILLWTAATTATYLLLTAVFRFGLLALIWWPICTGMVMGTVFWALRRFRVENTILLLAVPVALPLVVWFVAVPVGIRYFPYTTRVLLEGAIGPEAELNVISRVRVGDTYAELHQRFPALFPEPILGRTAQFGDESGYRIQFDETRTRVTSVMVRRHGESVAQPPAEKADEGL